MFYRYIYIISGELFGTVESKSMCSISDLIGGSLHFFFHLFKCRRSVYFTMSQKELKRLISLPLPTCYNCPEVKRVTSGLVSFGIS